MRIGIDDIARMSEQALLAHGAGAWQASEVARAVARAEETGNVICGLYYLESYCRQLVSGRVDGRVEPVVTLPRPGAVTVDARFGFAQPAFSRGLQPAIEAARACGIASLAVCHSHTCTSLGYFTEQIAAKGLIAIGVTNASAIVAGPGGKRPVIGTNPIAFTIPGPDGIAMHADFSTAAVALGKITKAQAAGERIPLGWAVDRNGKPTTDPAEALSGSLVSAADYKGWALGLLVEFLAAGLTGSVNSLDVKGLKAEAGPPHDLGQFYILIDPDTHAASLAERISRVAEAVADDPGVRIPGKQRTRLDAVEVAPALWQLVQQLAKAGTTAAG
ncbi:Ldh family oxidoreductase [Defluviimonas sp. WL0002]|uniref:Ldh family oxidoreductase n=1 Tax=Albidovulum marisflavi TaxID=2984159 RepID=A0ABT2ZCX0_9RHOB|nr:Ldh family oxidoreductase [Defluviimonas sp. WL0002]MCV2868915.1 Ldh family oxidoreductase [Defluviimonas sp. WL0002]